ncbi:MAG: hypothetical protein HOP11_00805 [Saprospiraceae bacterium]|nr:hypothetical protein [Saprospiraceae bacterium]
MKFTMYYLFFLVSMISCNRQTNTQSVNSDSLIESQAMLDSFSNMSENIMVIFQDKKNNYWFGSHRDGLYKYDGRNIRHFTANDSFPGTKVEEIKEDRFGNLYFNTNAGLFKYNGIRFLKIKEVSGGDWNWKLHPDDLWFKCIDYLGHLYRFDGNNVFKLKLPKTKLGEDYITKHNYNTSPYGIYCVYKDSKSNIWFGTAQLGACRYNGKSFDWISESDVTELHDGPSNGVRSIVEDKNGDFWFNTEYKYSIYNNTYIRNDTSKQAFYYRIKSIGCLDGSKEGNLNEYLSIIKDDKNNLWIALYLKGIWMYDGEKIKHYPIQINSKDIPIYCLYKDNKGDIWLGTHENGIFRFNGQTFEKLAI